MKSVHRIILCACVALSSITAFGKLDLPTKTVNGTEYYYYEVKPKESIYSLTKKLGVTRAEIMKHNPWAVDGVRASQILLFPVGEVDGTVEEPVIEGPVEKVPVEKVLVAEQPVVKETINEKDIEVADAAEADTISIAVLLPFMLENERPTKASENFTEFYRGLMMAVDTVASKNPELAISVVVFDTEGSAERVSDLAEKADVKNATYIIAPDDSLSIEILASNADVTGATVVNLFSVRNDAQTRHESVYQANIPHTAMYDKAASSFVDAFADYTPVFLQATDIAADKSAFADLLKSKLSAAGREYKVVEFVGALTKEMLEEAAPADSRRVFVPDAASREMLTRILDPLVELRSSAMLPDDVRLFGYPEWVIIRGERQKKLHQLHTAIYSRFATDTDSYPTRRVMQRYDDWFGGKMTNAAPVYGLLGYDTARWILDGGEEYRGLQNSFTPGNANNSLYFIYFAPEGNVRVKCLD